MSSFYVYDNDRNRIGMLQNEISVQWKENYQMPGEVKIEARATEENKLMLNEGNRIYNVDCDTAARVCHTEIAESENGFSIIARCDLTAELLSDRVVMATEIVGNIEKGMYDIYRKNRRDLPIDIALLVGYTETANTEITWGSVLEAENMLCEISGFGFRVNFNPETATELFEVYKGVDRSVQGSEDYVGYLGADMGNISNVVVVAGTSNYKNVAVVEGEDDYAEEGNSRVIRIISLGNVTGEDRREMYVDAKDLQREYQKAEETGEFDENGNPIYDYYTEVYTDEEFVTALEGRGYKQLEEQLKDFSVICDVEQVNIVYGRDYFMGDRLPIKLPEYGIFASAVVSSVLFVYENEQKKTVTLDNFRVEKTYIG